MLFSQSILFKTIYISEENKTKILKRLFANKNIYIIFLHCCLIHFKLLSLTFQLNKQLRIIKNVESNSILNTLLSKCMRHFEGPN